MRRYLLPCLFSTIACTALLTLGASEASAGERLTFGFDGDLVVPFETGIKTNLNAGVDGRIGWRAYPGRRDVVFIQPEISLGLQELTSAAVINNKTNASGASLPTAAMGRALVGARLGFGRFVQPQAIFHLGYGFGDVKGFTMDAGAALDFKVRNFSFGAHGTFNYLSENNYSVKWVDIGPHIGVYFL